MPCPFAVSDINRHNVVKEHAQLGIRRIKSWCLPDNIIKVLERAENTLFKKNLCSCDTERMITSKTSEGAALRTTLGLDWCVQVSKNLEVKYLVKCDVKLQKNNKEPSSTSTCQRCFASILLFFLCGWISGIRNRRRFVWVFPCNQQPLSCVLGLYSLYCYYSVP